MWHWNYNACDTGERIITHWHWQTRVTSWRQLWCMRHLERCDTGDTLETDYWDKFVCEIKVEETTTPVMYVNLGPWLPTYPIGIEMSSQTLLLCIWVISLLPLSKLLTCTLCMLLLPLQTSHDRQWKFGKGHHAVMQTLTGFLHMRHILFLQLGQEMSLGILATSAS